MIFRLLAAAMLTILTTLAGIAGTTGPAGAATEPPGNETTASQRLSAYVLPGVVYVESTWSAKILDTYINRYVRDQPLTRAGGCTGFVVTPDGYIATAGHCVNPVDEKYDIDTRLEMIGSGVDYVLANDVYGENVNRNALIRYALRYWKLVSPTSRYGDRLKYPALSVTVSWGADVSGLDAEQSKPARVMGRSTFDGGDVALLKVEASGLNALPLADEPAETGTDIAAIGYPEKVDLSVDVDLTPSLKTGTVSSSKTVGSGITSVYEIDAAVAPGMSGGPTVDLDGTVIGVNSFGPYDGSEAFNFVRPVSLIREMMGDAGTEPTQSPITELYVAGLDAYFTGDKATAVKNLSAVVEDQPANGLASDYLKKAKALPDPKPTPADSGSSLPWILGGAAAALMVLLAGLLAFVRGRRKRDRAGTPRPPVAVAVAAPTADDLPRAEPGDSAEPGRYLVDAGAGPPTPAGFGSPPSAGFSQPTPPEGTAAPPIGDLGQRSTGPDAPTGSTSRSQFCTTCGATLVAGTHFCGECGTKV